MSGRMRKWLIIAVVCIAVFLAVSEAIDIILAPVVEHRIGERLKARVEIEGFDFRLFSGISAGTMTIRPPAGGTDIRLTDVEIDHRLRELLTGKYRISGIGIETLKARMVPGFFQWIAGLRQKNKLPVDIPQIDLLQGAAGFHFPWMNRPLELENIRVTVWRPDTRRVMGAVSFSAGKNAVRLQFNAVPSEPYIESDIHVRGFDLSSLPPFETGDFRLNPAHLDVRGIAEGKIRVFFPNGPNRPPDVSGNLTLSGFNIRHPQIPLELTNGAARVEIANRSITLRDADFNFDGGNVEIPAAGFQLSEKGIERFWCRADLRDLDIPAICKSECFRAVPEKYRPEIYSGTVAAALRAQWARSEGIRYAADMTLRDVSGDLDKKGIAVSALDAEGSIDSSGRVLIRNARGRVFGGRAEAAGEFMLAGGKVIDPQIQCWFNDITQSPVLIGMLPPGVRKAIDFTGIKGAETNGFVGIDSKIIHVDANVHAKSAELPKLPFRLSDAETDVKWTSGTHKVILDNFKGTIEGSPVDGSATLLLGKPLRSDFILRGRYLPLNREILDWLQIDLKGWETGGSFDLVLQGEKWRPVKGSVLKSLKGLKAHADLRDVYLSRPGDGTVAENCFGNLSLGKEAIQLANLRGNLFGINFRGSGNFPLYRPRDGHYVEVESENITLGPRLYERLPFDLGLGKLGLTGQCKLQGEVQIKPGEGKRLYDANIKAVLHHLEMMPGATRMTASGTSQVHIGGEDLHRPKVDGKINFDELTVGNLEGDRLFTDFRFTYPDLKFRDIDISAYGGKLTSDEVYVNVETGKWQTAAGVSHVDFESLMGAYGKNGRETPSGVLRGNITIGGTGLNPETFAGKGKVKIDRGQLYSFPLLVTTLSLFDLHLPSQSPVTDAYGVYNIKNGWIEVEDLMFTGGSVPVHVEGKLGLKKGVAIKDEKIDLIVTVARTDGLLNQIPVVSVIKTYTLDLLRKIVFQARARGTFSDYRVDMLSSPVVRPIQKMWKLLDQLTPVAPGEEK